jgi:hypothetical protein
MTTDAAGTDPLFNSLNQLVVAGQLTPEEAQIAHDAVRRADRAPRLDRVLIAVGVAFVWAAVWISTSRARGQGDIDWSNYLMGIAGTLGLIGVAVAAYFLVTDLPLRSNLMAWPGAVGAIAAGQMVGVAMDDSDATVYVLGLVIAGLSAGGYYLTRRGVFLVSGLAGLAALYVQLYDDLLGFDDIDGDNFAMTIAAVIAFYTVAVTAAGWFLPATRDLTGVLAGIVSVVGFSLTMIALSLVGVVSGFFASFDDSRRPKREDTWDNDVWVILLIAALLCAGWAWCAWQSGHMGYRLLIIAMVVSIVPFSTLALAVQHPTWWELVVGLMGAAALGFAGLRAMGGLDEARAKLLPR